MLTFNKIIKEPLLHFMILGGLLFLAFNIFYSEADVEEDDIVITKERIVSISERFANKWNRAPQESELKALIDQHILTEAYYKEAVKLGLDKNDPVVKQRMRKKMEFFTSDALSLIDVEDETLQKYMETYPEKFRKDTVYTFEQIYISPNKHRDNLKNYLVEVEEQIRSGKDVVSDSLLLSRNYKNVSTTRLSSEFGKEFVTSLDTLNVQEWSNPISSGLGLHFVKVSDVQPSKLYALEEVRESVLREYMYDKRKEMLALEQKNIMGKYTIRVEIEDNNISEVN